MEEWLSITANTSRWLVLSPLSDLNKDVGGIRKMVDWNSIFLVLAPVLLSLVRISTHGLSLPFLALFGVCLVSRSNKETVPSHKGRVAETCNLVLIGCQTLVSLTCILDRGSWILCLPQGSSIIYLCWLCFTLASFEIRMGTPSACGIQHLYRYIELEYGELIPPYTEYVN